ncbi:MAG TPA: helix-turn-helix domain-containing protein [Solirubrobacteraceae bacterium]|nr:helix-turn-helix domain-containing protein [Solirubrobacteraceae bacterium]
MSLGEPHPPAPRAPRTITTRADLARELTALRSRAGLTVRELARRLDTPAATIGGYVSGRHLPGVAQAELFAAMLRECGVAASEMGDWLEALTRVRLASDARVGRAPSPYRGLEAFQVDDAEIFFGRGALTQELLARLDVLRSRGRPVDAPALMVVVGPSGCGKSSLLRAGVAAHLAAAADSTEPTAAADSTEPGWSVGILTPGENPMAALRAAFATTHPPHRLLIIDQLEEVFATSATARSEFLDELARLQSQGTMMLAGLRADFYEPALHEPLLLPALRDAQILVGPMTERELREAIIEPARRYGVHIEAGLVELLLADLSPSNPTGFAHDAGALPLLSHALLATWQRSQRNDLTIGDYRAAGGLRGAVSQSAEELYGQLTPLERELARRIFCRLARVADDAPVTRRRVSHAELAEIDGPGAREVLRRFLDSRLVSVDAEAYELSHEALLSAWPRLANWLQSDRAGLRLHHQLTDAANAWAGDERDPSLLLRGARLQVFVEWAQERDHNAELNRLERDFLDASRAQANAERQAARRRTRRMQQLLGVATALGVAALGLAIVALHARDLASLARDQALSRQVAIEAGDLQATDPALAMQLAVAAYRISPTTQATSTLLDASAAEMPTRLLGPIGPTTLALSRDGRVLAVAYSASDLVRLYSVAGSHVRLITDLSSAPSSSDTYALALNRDGTLLAAGGTDHQVVLWSLRDLEHPRRLATLDAGSGTVYGLSFAPDGAEFAAADANGTVARWSLRDPARPLARAPLVAPGRPAFQAVSYSPSGATLAAAGAGGALDVWRPDAGLRPLSHLTVGPTTLTSVAYSPDGRTLVAGGQNALIYRFALGARGTPAARRAPLRGFASWVDSLAFSADGRYLAAGDSDNSLRVWATAGWRHIATLDHPAPVTGVAFTSGSHELISVDEDGTTRLWPFPPPSTFVTSGSLYNINFTANGDELAAFDGGPNGDVSLWNLTDPWHPAPIGSITVPGRFGAVAGVGALSPNGRLVAVGNAAAKVQLISLAQRGHPRLLGARLGGAVPSIEQLTFSPNMRLLSVGDDAGRIHLWDVSHPSRPVALPTLDPRGRASNVFGVAYSPNGKLLAAACADHRVWLWSIADPRHPRLITTLGGFTSYAYTVTFSPDGRTLIAGGADDTVRLWNVRNPLRPRLLARLTGPTSTVYQVAVSPDGRTLAASTTDRAVWLWNIADPTHPRVLADLTAATGEVFDVAFAPNDRTMIAGGTDDLLTFWNFHPGQVVRRICGLAGSPVTRAEWSQYVQGAAYRPPCLGSTPSAASGPGG